MIVVESFAWSKHKRPYLTSASYSGGVPPSRLGSASFSSAFSYSSVIRYCSTKLNLCRLANGLHNSFSGHRRAEGFHRNKEAFVASDAKRVTRLLGSVLQSNRTRHDAETFLFFLGAMAGREVWTLDWMVLTSK